MQATLTHLALHVHNLEACIDFYRAYCGMHIIHERLAGEQRVVWMAEPGREQQFIFVLISRGPVRQPMAGDYRHFGFALPSQAAVDAIAAQGRAAQVLIWEPRQEPYPVGYYCALQDPDGNTVEFSYGQPLGPGSNMVNV